MQTANGLHVDRLEQRHKSTAEPWSTRVFRVKAKEAESAKKTDRDRSEAGGEAKNGVSGGQVRKVFRVANRVKCC